jgi:hypothetical protein
MGDDYARPYLKGYSIPSVMGGHCRAAVSAAASDPAFHRNTLQGHPITEAYRTHNENLD